MNRFTRIYIIIIAIALISCEKEIQLELDTPPVRLVVEGGLKEIRNSQLIEHEIRLSTMGDYFSTTNTARINDALVSVVDATGINYDFIRIEDGRYVNNELVIQDDMEYTLNIVWNNELYQATESMVRVSELERVYQQFEEENTFEDGGLKLAIDFTDPVEESNYYFWEIYSDGRNLLKADPGNSGNIIAKDEFWNGQSVEGYFPNEELVVVPGQVVTVRQHGISKAYYDYLFLLFEQTGQTGQFLDVPPSLIRGNIRNLTYPNLTPLGYFSVNEIDEVTVTVTE